jgi:creatinine amidohydrolase
MRIADMSWMQLEEHLKREDRAVLPIGSTEQHAYLSLATDAILAERVAVEAAEPLGIPVFPVLAYGITPHFTDYPGTVTLSVETYRTVVQEILDSLARSGFRRLAIVNGHGGNAPVQPACAEWAAGHPSCRVRFHSWWNAPRTTERVKSIDPIATHASWMESFAWTRVAGEVPAGAKEPIDWNSIADRPPAEVRKWIGDGSFGGRYQRPDSDMEAIWNVAVEETRELLAGGWS